MPPPLNYIISRVLVLICALWPFNLSPDAMAQAATMTWSIDPQFALLPPIDIEGRGLCVSVAPANQASWGIESFVFSDDRPAFGSKSLDWYAIHNRNDGLYLYGRETQGEWGLTRVVQGDAWGGTQCGTRIGWHVPAPVPADRITGLTVAYRQDQATLLTSDGSWLMMALNAWFRAPEYPKPLVVDFVLHHQCNNAPDCRLRFFESDDAFHYMYFVEDPATADYPAIIAAAQRAEYRDECVETSCTRRLPEASPTLQQFEFVIEVHRAEAAAFVDHLAIHTRN